MATTTVRLDSAEERTLDELAEIYGGRSNALREGLRLLARTNRQQAALAEMLHDWELKAGPVDEEAVTEMADRYGL
jgi:Arc/MetJ-type ribon-helix-helix transcriptional regulator